MKELKKEGYPQVNMELCLCSAGDVLSLKQEERRETSSSAR